MFTDLLRALFNLFCSNSDTKPQEQEYPQQTYPQQTYPQQEPQRPQHKPNSHRHEDSNQINQSNDYYVNLRARANEEGDAMASCFEQSHQAYTRGDGAQAKSLSNRGKEHQRQMELLNKQAADWIFIENNKDSKPGEVDLHGLYVKEAISRTDEAIEAAKLKGASELRLIVGKGLHSKDGTAKIKPAIEELMQKHSLRAELDPYNAGVLIVHINSGNARGVDADEIIRQHTNEGCYIM
ncbi:hypothetical protein H0H92_012139 [Tricholoma furcatifolium]|nr:hypothetical protein H0H92_012139 [Tricholoma furcatifolium]